MQFLSAREVARRNGLKVLIYGPAGAGKTSLIKTIPHQNQREVVVVDFEGGVLALADSDVLIVPVTNAEELKQAIEEVCKTDRFKVIAFDGLSLFVRSRVQALLAESGKQRPTWQEWQIVTREVGQAIFPLLHSVGRVILFTSLSKVEYAQVRVNGQMQSVPKRIRPDLPPAISHEVIAAMDLVGYLVSPRDQLVKHDSRMLLFQSPNGELEILTKTRANVTSCEANLGTLLQQLSIDLNSLKPSMLVSLPDNATRTVATETDANEHTPTTVQSSETQTRQVEAPMQETRPQEAPKSTQVQTQNSERQAMISEIFKIANQELGMDNKSLGRLARSMFGSGLIRELSDENLTILLETLRKQVKERKEAEVSVQTLEEGSQVVEPVQSVEELNGESILDTLLPDWREQPHAELLAQLDKIFVPPEWTKELAEIMILQAIVEVGLPIETSTADGLKDERVVRRLLEELS